MARDAIASDHHSQSKAQHLGAGLEVPQHELHSLIEENTLLRTKLMRAEQSLVNAEGVANKLYYQVKQYDQ